MQEQFIKEIKSRIQDHNSFVQEVASILDIGYDAAYRRVNQKSNLSLEEVITLARHYNISLNKLFEVGSQYTIITELSPRPSDEKGLELWFKQSLKNVAPLTKVKNAEIIWSGKDISLLRTLKDSYLTRYKMYVWLKDLNTEMAKSKISFDDWVKTIPKSLLDSAFQLSEIYEHINIIELWNDNTVNGTLQQILYYYEAGLVSKEMALKICDDVQDLVDQIEKQTIDQSLNSPQNGKFFKLYKCDLHTLTNTVMIVTPFKKLFFSPFTVLSYFKVEHDETCEMMHAFLTKQMAISKLLATAGERDRIIFFKTIGQKILITKERIQLDEKMAFL